MNNLLEKNIYDVQGKVLICGMCLPAMQQEGFKKLSKNYDDIMYVCLEKEHINMAITKICSMLSTNKISLLSFASVNRSPHCTQLHYITKEIKRIMDNNKLPEIKNIIVENNELFEIDDETISLSKDLIKLSNLK